MDFIKSKNEKQRDGTEILTVKDASAWWGISIRRVTALCEQGRIEGAIKAFLDYMLFCDNEMAKMWACGISIDFDYRKIEAIDILCKLASSQDVVISRSSRMSLYVRCGITI